MSVPHQTDNCDRCTEEIKSENYNSTAQHKEIIRVVILFSKLSRLWTSWWCLVCQVTKLTSPWRVEHIVYLCIQSLLQNLFERFIISGTSFTTPATTTKSVFSSLSTNLRCCLFNARSIVNKSLDLKLMIECENLDIIGVTILS